MKRNTLVKFHDYEIPLLQALVKLGGYAKTKDVYPVIKQIMKETLKKYPEEYNSYKDETELVWKNKTRWAREFLKRKGQLDGLLRGAWIITDEGRDRLVSIEKSGFDPDLIKPRLKH